MKKQLKLSGLLVMVLVSTLSCNNFNTDYKVLNSQIKAQKPKTSISGIVQFPDSHPNPLSEREGTRNKANSEFNTKATLTEVATSATVSIIYPSVYAADPSKQNVVIASGLTASTGAFSINPSATFSPSTGDVFTLEAIKRLGGASNDAIALRTILKWNGTSFDSITTPSIYINSKTTALAIIVSLSPSDVTSSAAIGTMATSGGASVVTTINGTVTYTLINHVKDLVDQQLAANKDPVSTIEIHSGTYSVHQEVTPNSVTYTGGCVGEPTDC